MRLTPLKIMSCSISLLATTAIAAPIMNNEGMTLALWHDVHVMQQKPFKNKSAKKRLKTPHSQRGEHS